MAAKLPNKPSGKSLNKSSGKASAASPARREAFAILLRLEREELHADDLLRGPKVSALSAQDRNLCTTLVMGTLRWQIALDVRIRGLLAKPNARLDPEIRVALRLGAFQLVHLDRIPAHAAIGESVALAKFAGHRFASGMVNAVLRKLASAHAPEGDAAATQSPTELAAATAHPLWMVERWVSFYGLEAAKAICEHGQRPPELTIRLPRPEVEEALSQAGIELQPGAVLSSARRVVAGDVTSTRDFQTGKVRIQDEGSQLIAELAGRLAGGLDNTPARILDCCAAPGGKTLILAERNPQARITACEISPARLEAMRLRFAGLDIAGLDSSDLAPRIELLQADAAALPDAGSYDLVLADVPCSGTGTLGRNPEIRHRLRPEDLARHHERQVAILRGALRAASAPGGQVLYSTCSLEPEENAAVVAEALEQAPAWHRISLASRLEALLTEGRLIPAGAEALRKCITAEGFLMLLPGSLSLAGSQGTEAQTDGFFAALLEFRATSLPSALL